MENNELREQNRKILEELNALRYNNGKQEQDATQDKNKPTKPWTRYASIVTLQKGEQMEGATPLPENGSPQRRVIKSILKENLKVDDIGGPTMTIIPLYRCR